MRKERIDEAVRLNLSFGWSAGDSRIAPNGTVLGGTRDRTYWTHRVSEGPSADLMDALAANLSYLEAHKDFFRAFTSTGGEVEYDVAWFSTDVLSSQTLPPDLLRRMAELHIDLGFDVYGRE
jgi:hypothetical protein